MIIPPIGAPVLAVTAQRYDASEGEHNHISYESLNWGEPPARIPRFWNMGLSYLSGPDYWGFQQHNHATFIPHFPVYVPQRDRQSIRAALGPAQPLAADRMYIPAVYVGYPER